MTAAVAPLGTTSPGTIAAWALRETRRIVCKEIGSAPAKVFLFGSWATGRADRLSDIDVGILPLTLLSPALFATIRECLEDSDIPFRVDVVDLSEVDEDFRARVLREGTLWIG